MKILREIQESHNKFFENASSLHTPCARMSTGASLFRKLNAISAQRVYTRY